MKEGEVERRRRGKKEKRKEGEEERNIRGKKKKRKKEEEGEDEKMRR